MTSSIVERDRKFCVMSKTIGQVLKIRLRFCLPIHLLEERLERKRQWFAWTVFLMDVQFEKINVQGMNGIKKRLQEV